MAFFNQRLFAAVGLQHLPHRKLSAVGQKREDPVLPRILLDTVARRLPAQNEAKLHRAAPPCLLARTPAMFLAKPPLLPFFDAGAQPSLSDAVREDLLHLLGNPR